MAFLLKRAARFNDLGGMGVSLWVSIKKEENLQKVKGRRIH